MSRRKTAQVAARWLVRRQSGHWDEAEEKALAAWLALAPEHRREFEALQSLWSALDQAQGALRPAHLRSRRTARVSRRMGWGGAACCMALMCLVMSWVMAYQAAQPVWHKTLSTTARQQLETTLPDGSTLALNVNTELAVQYFRNRRDVSLVRGEAFFQVVRDAKRPFIVRAQDFTARVLGTQFVVYLAPDAVRVSVRHGHVEVQSRVAEAAPRLVLAEGEGARLAATITRYKVQTEEVAAWRLGHVVFRQRPLVEVLQEVGRYRTQPVILASAKFGERRISGVLHVDNPDGFLAALPHILPVAVQRQPDGTVVVMAKP